MLEHILKQRKITITLDLQNIERNNFELINWKLIEVYVEVLKLIFKTTTELKKIFLLYLWFIQSCIL